MKTDLEVEVEVYLRQFGKVLIFRDKQTNRTFPLYKDDHRDDHDYHDYHDPDDHHDDQDHLLLALLLRSSHTPTPPTTSNPLSITLRLGQLPVIKVL